MWEAVCYGKGVFASVPRDVACKPSVLGSFARAEKMARLKQLGIKDPAVEREFEQLSRRRSSVRGMTLDDNGGSGVDSRFRRMMNSA